LGHHRADIVVDEKVIVELKAIKFTPVKLEQQLFSYLRNSPYKVGLMINFGSSRLFIKRIILTK
jgi:GxxExxY protein